MIADPSQGLAPRGVHRFSQMERVYYGRPVAQALAEELAILDSQRVLLVTNRSLKDSAAAAEVARVLGPRLVGVYAGVQAHAPRACAIAAAGAARDADADLLLALGGGSVIDAAKAALLCLRHGYDTVEALEALANVRIADNGHAPSDAADWRRMVAVPTTLSAAEFACSAGLTDSARGLKQAFVHPMLMPQAVVFDPAMTLSTPLPLMVSTGMKALDHAVERMTSAQANPFSDAVSQLALRMLFGALKGLAAEPDDLALRGRLQYGAFMSMAGSSSGVAVNVSHAIGHVLGGHAGVPHGHTTGVTLPAVLRWNHDATGAQQDLVRDAIGAGSLSAADALIGLVTSLGLPHRLRDIGLARDDLPLLAHKTMHEHLLRNSRKPVRGPSDIEDILQSAW